MLIGQSAGTAPRTSVVALEMEATKPYPVRTCADVGGPLTPVEARFGDDAPAVN